MTITINDGYPFPMKYKIMMGTSRIIAEMEVRRARTERWMFLSSYT